MASVQWWIRLSLYLDRIERVAATLQVPYLLWVLFATLLSNQFRALNA